MKKFRGFTLIELIVVMAIFGIIMTGLMNIMAPITEASNTQRVANNQNRVQSSMISYIGENLRYSYDLAVVKGGTMKNAVDKFIAMEPVDINGKKIDFDAHPEMKEEIQIICFDGYSAYKVGDSTADFYGRVLRSNNAYGPAGGYSYAGIPTSDYNSSANCSPEGNKPLYLTLGTDYYSSADYFLTANIVNDTIELTIDSDYYYSPAKTKMLSTEHDVTDANDKLLMTTGRYELKNKGTGSFKFKMLKKDGTDLTTPASTSRVAVGDADNCIFFVFLTNYIPMDGHIGLEGYEYYGGGSGGPSGTRDFPVAIDPEIFGYATPSVWLSTTCATPINITTDITQAERDSYMGPAGLAFDVPYFGRLYVSMAGYDTDLSSAPWPIYRGNDSTTYTITYVDSTGREYTAIGTAANIQENFESLIVQQTPEINGYPFDIR